MIQMISAKRASRVFEAFKDIVDRSYYVNPNAGADARVNERIIAITNASVVNAIRDGFDSCISYILNPHVKKILRNHGYRIIEETEDDIKYSVISWESAGKNRKEIREDYKW
jgi:hypothetical protein